MAFKATAAQQSAIDAKGNILVSAAAGSGKTAVLVERVIGKLCSKEDAIPADKLLIVTFTNAAAAEMRTRIEKRLQEECIKDPDNVALTLQKHLLTAAKICTIDSFCIDLVRENFELAGVAPDFKIADSGTLNSINQRVLSQIVERYLDSNNQTFDNLMDIIGTEYSEQSFYDFILSVYDYSRQLPFPKKWFKSLPEFYSSGKFTAVSPWYIYAFSQAVTLIENSLDAIENAIQLLSVSQKAADAYMPAFLNAKEILSNLLEKAHTVDWDEFYECLFNNNFDSLPTLRGVKDIFEIAAAKEIYKTIIPKNLERISKIFFADTEFLNSQFAFLEKPIELLSEILIEFDDAVFEEYKNLNSFTFHNTEHLALNLLCEEKDGQIVIKSDELLSRFEEVMVDEYQDTNDLQDMLFYVLSNRESKLFVVGDIKQSIYGFRGANPSNFLSKKNRYIPIANADSTQPQKIILGNNFRTKPKVCDFINFFFTCFMSENTGDIVYNEEEMLIPSAKFPEAINDTTSLLLISPDDSELPLNILEARQIAKYISSVMEQGNIIRDSDDNLRPARYSDFAILLRSARLKAPVIAEQLRKANIPVNFSGENFAEGIEIATILNLLTVIDNPESDIELLSVLMSPIFSFTAEELAIIRADNKKCSLYSAIIQYADSGDAKTRDFLKRIEFFRLLSVTNTLPQLISRLLEETMYLDFVSTLNDGASRRNNLLLLCELAENYVSDSPATIANFVRFIKTQSESGIKSASSSITSDAVKIMSIHSSKGLQFPICIVAGCASAFNDSEAHENAIYTTKLGLGLKYFDEKDKIKYTTVGREVILDSVREERLREELRLFYVAMTRTQDRLVFTAALSNFERKINQIKTLLVANNGEINSNVFCNSKSYLDWLIISALLHPDSKALRSGASIIPVKTESQFEVLFTSNEESDFVEEDSSSDFELDEEVSKTISNNIKFEYPYSKILEIEAKSSVSKLANSAESAKFAFTQAPAFMSKDGISAAARGTAMHKVMQFFDFAKWNDIRAELERLYEWQFITETEYNSIDINKLSLFFESNIFKRIFKSQLVKREMRFLTEISACEIDKNLDRAFENELVVVQGAVDVCFAEPDGIVILDFKTDRVEDPLVLADTYGEQLNIYALACEKIFNMPVKQKVIYSFSHNKEIILD